MYEESNQHFFDFTASHFGAQLQNMFLHHILQLASTTAFVWSHYSHLPYCAVLGSPLDESNVIPKNSTTPIVVVVPGLTSDSSAAVSCQLKFKI